jgi:hypothetical protein
MRGSGTAPREHTQPRGDIAEVAGHLGSPRPEHAKLPPTVKVSDAIQGVGAWSGIFASGARAPVSLADQSSDARGVS